MTGRSESAELLSQVESEGEVPLGSYDSWIMAAAGAGSPLRGLVVTDEMRAMDDDAFLARLAAAREELGYDERLQSVRHGDGDATSGLVEFPLPRPLGFIVAARRAPAYIAITYVADTRDVSAEPALSVGWRGIDVVLHGVLGDEGRVGVLEERRDSRGVHQFVLRSPGAEAVSLYEGFVGRPRGAEGQLFSLHVFHPDETEPKHLEVRLIFEPDGAQTSRTSTDGCVWTRTHLGADATAGWIESASDALLVRA